MEFQQLEETLKGIDDLAKKYGVSHDLIIKVIESNQKDLSRLLVTGILDRVDDLLVALFAKPPQDEKKYPFEMDDVGPIPA